MSSITKPKKRVLVSYGVDIDAIAGWLGSYKGEDSTSDISRGESDTLRYIVAITDESLQVTDRE